MYAQVLFHAGDSHYGCDAPEIAHSSAPTGRRAAAAKAAARLALWPAQARMTRGWAHRLICETSAMGKWPNSLDNHVMLCLLLSRNRDPGPSPACPRRTTSAVSDLSASLYAITATHYEVWQWSPIRRPRVD